MITALSFAGSDSGGGAGIQADSKTFSALGAFATNVITAITAQNTQGVERVFTLPADEVAAQYHAVLSDFSVNAMKFGMLSNAEIIETAVELLMWKAPEVVILDTVMVAKSGHFLLDQPAISVLRDQLLNKVDLITPNLPEAAALLGEKIAENETEMIAQGKQLLTLGAKAVLMKGGHLNSEEAPDLLILPNETHRFSTSRVQTRHGHGTGCTYSAAITALYPRHRNWVNTIASAKRYLTAALGEAERLNVGQGIGPVHHFYRFW